MPKTKSKSKKGSSNARIRKQLLGPYEHFGAAYDNQKLSLVPTGTGGFEIGFAPAGRKQNMNMVDVLTGGKQNLSKLTEDQYLQAVISQNGGTLQGALISESDQRYKCLTGDYRTASGRCKPAPVTGMDQFLPVIERNAYVPRGGVFGGDNQVVTVPGANGSQSLRMRTSNGTGNSMFDILSNNGSQSSGGFYHKLHGLVDFYTNPYTKTVTEGYVMSPNYVLLDDPARTGHQGQMYAINDTVGMRRDGYKLGRLADGRLAATPMYYKNGPSTIPVQAPINFNRAGAQSWMNRNNFPPTWPVQPTPAPTFGKIDEFRAVRRRF